MTNQYKPEGSLISLPENHEYLSSLSGLEKALERQKILESTALLCDNEFNLHFDLCGIRGIMPRKEVQYAPNDEPIKDIAVLTRVGKPVCFHVIGFCKEGNQITAILSRRSAQRECSLHFIDALIPGDVIPAKVTHIESFGVFVDIGCGIVSLMSIDSISVSRILHPRCRFRIGDRIFAVIKSIDDQGRIYVTHRELLGTWEENAALFSAGQTVAGVVRSVESYGIFIELAPNLAGLAELKSGILPEMNAAVYIKSIIPEKMKIKLVIIDVHEEENSIKPLRYFIDPQVTKHIDRWRYSPSGCEKIIESVFE